MIVDTSALVAVLYREESWETIFRALCSEQGFIPAPVLFELHRVTSQRFNAPDGPTLDLIDLVLSRDIVVAPLTGSESDLAPEANHRYGSGNEEGGLLNMLDLMVYAAAKARDLPILCTGRDFASTDARIHPASRVG